MMKLFHTPASPFARKCSVAIRELGLEDRWRSSRPDGRIPGHRDGAVSEGFPYGDTIARIPALVTDDGERLTESSLICEYVNDELGDYRLSPQSGREPRNSYPWCRWRPAGSWNAR
jgi:glutathione S-transferase